MVPARNDGKAIRLHDPVELAIYRKSVQNIT